MYYTDWHGFLWFLCVSLLCMSVRIILLFP